MRPGKILECDDPRNQQAVNPFSNGIGNLLGNGGSLGAYYPATICRNIAYQYGQPTYSQPATPVKAEPEVKENSAMRIIKQLAIQDAPHPIGSKITSEEKLLTAVDLCHF
jgi:hypothetical protein